MRNLEGVLAVLLVASSSIGVVAAWPRAQAGSTWTIHYGDPGRTGNHKTTITISYIDAEGRKLEKSISASVSLTDGDSANKKREDIQKKMDEALSAPANTVGGKPLASTSGLGNAMNTAPSGDTSDFSGAKIESVKTEDEQTGEKDEIMKPRRNGLAQVGPEGELLGQTSDRGPSAFFVPTNLGTVSVTLSPGMSKLELLKALKAGLIALDSKVAAWVDSDLDVLFVKLGDGDDGIFTIGAGSTDQGLVAVCKVLVTD